MTKQTRVTHGSDYRMEAIQLVLDEGYSIPEAAQEANVSAATIENWIRQLRRSALEELDFPN